jgi:Domain of unknown function (DUF4158)
VASEFLTDEQAGGYGRFEGEPSQAELERFFFLDDADRALVAQRRGAHSRLGFAVQLGTIRFLGTFLSPDPLDVPWGVVDYLAGQLEIADSSVVKRYTDRPMTAYEHAWEIREAYGYRDFADAEASAQLRGFLAGAGVDACRQWLREEFTALVSASFGAPPPWPRPPAPPRAPGHPPARRRRPRRHPARPAANSPHSTARGLRRQRSPPAGLS